MINWHKIHGDHLNVLMVNVLNLNAQLRLGILPLHLENRTFQILKS